MKTIFTSIIISSCIFWGGEIFSQNIAINATGTAPVNCAMLDINSTSMGLLIPRVSLTNVTVYAPLTGAPVTSLLVFSTTAPTGGGGVGYYYWDGTKWIQLLYGGSGGTAWLTLGNLGTTAGTNFIGTTDAQALVFKTNNTEWMRIVSGGNVGIGTSAPAQVLHVIGTERVSTLASGANGAIVTSNTSGDMGITNFTGSTTNILLGNNTFGTIPSAGGVTSACGTLNYVPKMTNSTAMSCSQIFDNGTNVGIGTTTPVSKLDVLGLNSTAALNSSVGSLATFTSNTTVQLQFGAINGGSYAAWIQSKVDGQNLAYPIALQPAGGNVGIGTTAPAATLEVDGEIKFVNGTGTMFWSNQAFRDFDVLQSNSSTNRAFTVHAGSNSGSGFGNISVDFYGNDGAGNNLPGFTMLKNCNVGLGTTTPVQRLDVNGEIIAAEGIPNVSCNPINAGYSFQGDGCWDTGMFSPADGDLRFYSNDQYALQIVGTNLYAQSDIFLGVCGNWLSTLTGCSDFRYKKDIVPMKDVLSDVMKLQGVKYNWRKDEFPNMHFDDNRQIGFIAQEMQKVFPEVVNTNKDGYKSIDYGHLTAVLTEAIKEQQKLIENQQAAIDKQQSEIHNQDVRLKALEQFLKLQ